MDSITYYNKDCKKKKGDNARQHVEAGVSFCFSLQSVTQWEREREKWLGKTWITFRLEFYNCCIFPVIRYFTVVTFRFAPKQKQVAGLCTKNSSLNMFMSFCHFQRKSTISTCLKKKVQQSHYVWMENKNTDSLWPIRNWCHSADCGLV